MKKAGTLVFVFVLLASWLWLMPGLAEVPTEEMDEWTVLFYFCGSDLESRYGYATENLREIRSVAYADNFLAMTLEQRGIIPDEDAKSQPGRVNVLIETGGSSQWHTEEGDSALGMNIDPAALQRWSYNTWSLQDRVDTDEPDDSLIFGFELQQTLPLRSMADPETLADFIQWGVQFRPAKKYALVLWDHGDGARSGLFIDELFDKDMMYLYELRQALAEGGTHFDTVIIDACLMANIEAAWNLREYADWLVASEEIVPGEGTAIGDWLQQLMYFPEGSGDWLGRLVCDTTSVKYANEESDEVKSILTWSVIDLSKVDALLEVCRRFFQEMGDALREAPYQAGVYMRMLSRSAVYGDGTQHMREFGSMIYDSGLAQFGRRSIRSAAIQALSDAVVYCVRGHGRSEARGLTFCYPAGLSDAELDIYAKNFPMPVYLAYLDAVSDWSAPEWVYESTQRLPEIDDIEEFRIMMQKQRCADGMPGLLVSTGSGFWYLDQVYYTLYRLNEETGETVRLGRTDCITVAAENENYDLIWRAADPMHWPSVEGQLLSMDLVQSSSYVKLYNVPVMMDTQTSMLRMGRRVNYAEDETERINEYEVYGVWEGYEENSTLLTRSVKPLYHVVGREYQLLYPIDGTGSGSRMRYELSAPMTMYRVLDVEEIPLPAGTYFLEYETEDVFMRRTMLDRIEIRWDGESMTFPAAEEWEIGEWIQVNGIDKNSKE